MITQRKKEGVGGEIGLCLIFLALLACVVAIAFHLGAYASKKDGEFRVRKAEKQAQVSEQALATDSKAVDMLVRELFAISEEEAGNE